jgi:hypothetical protein
MLTSIQLTLKDGVNYGKKEIMQEFIKFASEPGLYGGGVF